MQWAKGIHTANEEDWRGVFIQRLPVLHLEGKDVIPSKDIWARSLTFTHYIYKRLISTSGLKDTVPLVNSKVEIEFRNSNEDQGEHERAKDELCSGYVSSCGGRRGGGYRCQGSMGGAP